MSDKLEKLTKQIYEEGVVKARHEAQQIIESAQAEKKKILRSARQESEDIINLAHKEAEEFKKKVESELRMAAQQSLALLKQKITGLISEKVANTSAEGLVQDAQFVKKILELVMKEWITSGCRQGEEILLKLPQEAQKDIQKHFLAKTAQELQQGLKIEFDKNIKGGFVITSRDGNYRIGFTEEDFKVFIQNFIRSNVKKFLFD
ncbi:MAG: hypothetical protein KKB82_08260 [Candidatus Omnitrophica bacterium]|nr:hypothetical protein [Candidatus Omnitrophota bacterium]MBU1925894.1 hypothetical protein [Candidatus Omnitrophota bacterium]MBU2064042.1 hypothetical protein [Candidatus Omnitrophota bacterium]